MKLPDVVRISGQDVTVKSTHYSEEDEYKGRCDLKRGEIRVSETDTSPDQRLAVLWHEMSHYHRHIHNQIFDDREKEETLVCQLGTMIHQLLRDNPELVKIYLERSV